MIGKLFVVLGTFIVLAVLAGGCFCAAFSFLREGIRYREWQPLFLAAALAGLFFLIVGGTIFMATGG